MQTDEFLESIQKGNLSRINQLLETNPGLANSKTKNGISALLLALYHGRHEIALVIAAKKPMLDIFEASIYTRCSSCLLGPEGRDRISP